MPGLAIAALTIAAGVHRFDAALGLAAVMGGIAGPRAGLESGAGDLVTPGFNLLAPANHSAFWKRLEELLLQPVGACQKTLRELSRATTTARLDYLQFGRLADHTDDIVESSKPDRFNGGDLPSVPVYPEQHVAAFRSPTFFLRSPDESAWDKAQSEIMNASVFLWDDGGVLTQLSAKQSAKGPSSLAKELVAAATGCDRYIDRGRQIGPGCIDAVTARFFISTSREVVRGALACEEPGLQRLLHSCVFAVPSRDPLTTPDGPNVRVGYEAFCEAVKKVLAARRNGRSYQLSPKPELRAEIEKSALSTRKWCSGLSPAIQPYFAQISSLPYRLCWACLMTLCPGEQDKWVAPFVRATVGHVLLGQQKFIEEQILAAEVAREQHARQVMLEKLASSGPCMLRELLRRYSSQRRELHLPVLDALINEGLIRRREDNHLELCDAGRKKA